MARGTFAGLSAIVVIIVIAYASAAPIQLQDGPNLPQRNGYGPPPLPNLLEKYFEDRGMEPRNLDNGLGSGRPSFRQTRRGLDSLSGATFGESKRFMPIRRPVLQTNIRPGNFDEIDRSVFDHFAKRNFDEIDRTAFDSFFKRNFDEIDRVGWSGFVKKLDNYLANKEQR